MAIPLPSLNDDPQSVDVIQMLISDESRDWVRVCMVSQIALLIFLDLKEVMRSVSVQQVLLNCIGGAMMVLRSL
jgi:hypothetical protein